MSDLDQIRADRANIARQRAELEKLDADLAVAERVLLGYRASGAQSPAPIQAAFKLASPVPSATRRDRVIQALSDEKLWMTSSEINLAIEKRHGALMKTNSLYPMLTNLKKEGVIVRDRDRMALKSRITEAAPV